MKKIVLTALVSVFAPLAANAGEFVAPKGYIAGGDGKFESPLKVELGEDHKFISAFPKADKLSLAEEQELLEKKLTEQPYCSETCRLWLKRPSTSTPDGEKGPKFAPSSVW